ncbi:MAG: hypothetical protein NVS2B16_08390 [Chloroflexota bacterium]
MSPVPFAAIAAIFLLVSSVVAGEVAYQLHRMSMPTFTFADGIKVKPNYLVVLVLDGARPDYFHLTRLPHMDALRQQGIEYDRAWAGILESETPSGHATLTTGSTPARDGLLGFNWITSVNDAVRLFDPKIVRAGGIEKVMQQAGAPTIAGLFKKRYPRAKVVAVSGHKYYAADPLGGPNADYILYYEPDAKNHYVPTAIPGHVPPASVLNAPGLSWSSTTMPPGGEDSIAVKLALHTFSKVHQQVTMINLPEFDWPLGHVDGADGTRARVLMRSFDRDLGHIEDAYRKAGVLDRTLFVITADHGMAPLQYQIPDAVLDTAVTRAGTTETEATYSTAGYLWLQDVTKAQAVADNIVSAREKHVQSVYYKVVGKSGDTYVRDAGLSVSPAVDRANQTLLQSFLGGNAPAVVAFCTERASFVTKGAETWKGNHGGGAWESQHLPLIFAGAGVTSAGVSHAPARLEDVAPTALTIMDVKTTGMQGTPLADAMQNASSRQTDAQVTLNKALSPVVDALRAQSRSDNKAYARH